MFNYFKKKKFLSQVRNEKHGTIQLGYIRPEVGEINKKVLNKDLKVIKKAFKPYTKIKHIFPAILKGWDVDADQFDINILGPNTFYPSGWDNARILKSSDLYICYPDESKIHALIQSLDLKIVQIYFCSYSSDTILESMLDDYVEFVGETSPSIGLPEINCHDCGEVSNTPDIDEVLDNRFLISCSCCGDKLDYPLTPKQHRKFMKSFYEYAIKG